MSGERRPGPAFDELAGIIRRLREPGGCPWDRAQDVRSIVDFFLEEAFETAEACLGGDPEAAKEELGDMLMEIVFLARLFEEEGRFDLAGALEGINAKMIRRHPHVFGGEAPAGPREVMGEWQRRKLLEKERTSVLEGLPRSAPALLQAFEIGQKVSAVGFDWADARRALEKVREELGELESELDGGREREIREELGDLFFALANVARLLRINPELALRGANRKFARRFALVEERLRENGRGPGEATLEEMDAIWEDLKAERRKAGPTE